MTVMPRDHAWTVADLAPTPDDGLRYEVVDPLVPSVRAWVLIDGHYLDAGYAEGGQALRVEQPFPVTVTPQDLVDG